MPMHDWTRVDAGLFHAFHHAWIEELARALNRGLLPGDYFALPEQNVRGPIPDVLTLKLSQGTEESPSAPAGVAVATHPPKARLTMRAEADSLHTSFHPNMRTDNFSRITIHPCFLSSLLRQARRSTGRIPRCTARPDTAGSARSRR